MNIVKLAYYDEFHCAGPECRDTCCKYWHISLSKKEYLGYKAIKCGAELRAVMDNAFKIKLDGNELDYAEVRLNGEGKCPLLGKDSLCMIQKELGEGALCFTCAVFPRLHMKVGGGAVMMSCSPTCCRVTELLMSHPEGLKIVEEEYGGGDRYINADLFTLPRLNADCKEFSCYWSVLGAQIGILQNRDFTVPERMLLLGYFCQKADGYIKSGKMSGIASLADMLSDKALCARIAESLKPKQSDKNIALSSVRILYKMYRAAQSSYSPFVTQSFNRIMGRLAVTSAQVGGEEPNISFNFEEYGNLAGIFGEIMNGRPYIIENLLVNLVFSQNIKDGVWTNYFTLAVFYNILKLCVPVFLKEGYTDGELAMAITYAVKLVLNTNLVKSNVLVDSMLRGEYSLPYAAFLIC